MRGDLHVHSCYSTRPSQWILQKLGCPESFTKPETIYRIAKERGMEAVTITDHNTIDGVLEIAHYPDVFISEEVTSYFPEDGCKVHVLVYHISESQHREIQKIRENVYDLVYYLNATKILHAVAHPLFGVNGKLTVEHIEKMLLLFRIFEINGARNEAQNRALRLILEHISSHTIQQLTERHGITPFPERCHEKIIIGGSDDHSGLHVARYWTEVPVAHDIESFLDGVREGSTHVGGVPATPLTMARTLYSIAYQYYRERLRIERYTPQHLLLQFLHRVLDVHTDNPQHSSWSSRIVVFLQSARVWGRRETGEQSLSLSQSLMDASRKLIQRNPHYLKVAQGAPLSGDAHAETLWFQFISEVSNTIVGHLLERFVAQCSRANFFDIFGTVGAVGALSSLIAPYLAAFSHFVKDRRIAQDAVERLIPMSSSSQTTQPFSIGHFSDTLFEVNGVAKTLLQFREAAQALGYQWTIITSTDHTEKEVRGVKNFPPIGTYALPEYPELTLAIPPFLELLSYCATKSFTQLHAATPGPMGLAALLIARILSVPIVSTYHTAIPHYVHKLTGDEHLEIAAWRYVLWYYSQMDCVFVPSRATANELVKQGFSQEKIRFFQRGVDTDTYHPRKASVEFRRRYGFEGRTIALYVGRISREKGLDVLARAFSLLRQKHPSLALVIVGDGPYRPYLEALFEGTEAAFTGYLSGDDLAEAYASCDFFVFPSATDTFGNVVLEAQASGLPVVVSDEGGPKENIVPGETGYIFRAHDAADLARAMELLVINREVRRLMGKKARETMETRSFVKAAQATWDLYCQATSSPSDISLRQAV